MYLSSFFNHLFSKAISVLLFPEHGSFNLTIVVKEVKSYIDLP